VGCGTQPAGSTGILEAASELTLTHPATETGTPRPKPTGLLNTPPRARQSRPLHPCTSIIPTAAAEGPPSTNCHPGARRPCSANTSCSWRWEHACCTHRWVLEVCVAWQGRNSPLVHTTAVKPPWRVRSRRQPPPRPQRRGHSEGNSQQHDAPLLPHQQQQQGPCSLRRKPPRATRAARVSSSVHCCAAIRQRVHCSKCAPHHACLHMTLLLLHWLLLAPPPAAAQRIATRVPHIKQLPTVAAQTAAEADLLSAISAAAPGNCSLDIRTNLNWGVATASYQVSVWEGLLQSGCAGSTKPRVLVGVASSSAMHHALLLSHLISSAAAAALTAGGGRVEPGWPQPERVGHVLSHARQDSEGPQR
jgi:hypothetical protein